MKANALIMNERDNVVTCIVEVKKGETIRYLNENQLIELISIEDIPSYHKIAITQISKGDQVMKYGESIGTAECNIEKGGWVSHLNICSVPRDYESEMHKEE